MCRMRPAPRRCAIPLAAVASPAKRSSSSYPMSRANNTRPIPQDAVCTRARHSASPELRASLPW
eukprot:6872539-Pyramimonas_sp.AAC.1